MQMAVIPLDVLDRGVVDPNPAVAAAHISVVVPAVERLASVHYIPNEIKTASDAAAVTLKLQHIRIKRRVRGCIVRHHNLAVVITAFKAQKTRGRCHFQQIAAEWGGCGRWRSANTQNRGESNNARILRITRIIQYHKNWARTAFFAHL
jgi:hypothetical protein